MASPVYGGAPSPTIKRYVEIIEQNNGINNSNNVLFSSAPNERNESVIDLSKIAGSEIFS